MYRIELSMYNGIMNKIIYKRVLPEILLDLGEETEYDDLNSPKKNIVKLHINLENWLGDDLLWNFPEVIVTERLKKDLENNKDISGYVFDSMKVTKDVYFSDDYQSKKNIPVLFWMRITGKENVDDFFIKNGDLYISERALTYIEKNFELKNAQIDLQKNEFDDFILGLVEKDKKKQEDN